MHLGNGALTPECACLTITAAAAGLAMAAVSARREPQDRRRWLNAGALCAAVYAAQMVNVPVLPFSSAHLIGGVLLAWCLGPALGSLTMAVVLAVQALLLGDGGLAAWGANTLNMALLPAGLVWAAQRFLPAARSAWQNGALVFVVSVASVILASGFIVLEVTLFRGPGEISGLSSFAARMVALHAWLGIAEGLATCAVLYALGLLGESRSLRQGAWRLAGISGASLVLILAFLPVSSALPDGYETAAELSGLKGLLIDGGDALAWQASLQSGVEQVLGSEQLIGLGTMCVAGLIAASLALACQRRLVPARVVERETR